MSLDCGRKLENREGTHADTGRTRKLHKEEPDRPDRDPNPGSSCFEATLLAATPPRSPKFYIYGGEKIQYCLRLKLQIVGKLLAKKRKSDTFFFF